MTVKRSLSSPGVPELLAKQILADIDEYAQKAYDDGHRNHLGASLIGHDCNRYLWYIFRWCLHEKFSGRMLRLFNRGHREEDRFIEFLEGIGFKIWFEDRETKPLFYVAENDSYYLGDNLEDNGDGLASPILSNHPEYKSHLARAKADGIKFPQYRVSGVMGHFGGSLDGIAILPERYGIEEPVLLEFKTNGTGAGFAKLASHGMPLAKPQHFAQTCTYGYKGVNGTTFNYVVYLNVCKNDDDLHVEVVKLNHKLGEQIEAKAEQIIRSDKPPARISDNPTYFTCKGCGMHSICHKGAMPEVNCRSCKFATPVENAQWFCSTHNGVIPKDFIKQACPSYKAITENV
jgi:hypothetical protein